MMQNTTNEQINLTEKKPKDDKEPFSSFRESHSQRRDVYAEANAWFDEVLTIQNEKKKNKVKKTKTNPHGFSDKRLISAVKTHNNLKTKKGLGSPHKEKFPFNVNAEAWVDHLLEDDPNDDVVAEFIDHELEASNFITQRKTFKISCSLSIARLKSAAFAFPLCAQTMGIEVDETTTVTSGVTGSLYLMYLTIYYDLLLACTGEISIFSEAHPEYCNLRASLMPRTVDGFAYSFDMDNIASMQNQLGAGISFITPVGSSSASLARFNGNLDSAGRKVLVNTPPALSIDDLLDPGIEICERVWSRMVKFHDQSAMLRSIYERTGYENTAAAFSQVTAYGEDSYLPFCRVTSEVRIPGWSLYIAALDLVNASDRRGLETYVEIRGPGVLTYRIYNNLFHRHHYMLYPKQIAFESFVAQYTASIVQADIISDNLPTSGLVTQPSTSFTGSVSSGEVIEALAGALCKRYAVSATIVASMDALNPGVNILGAGRQYYVPMDVINFHVSIQMQEAMAELATVALKRNTHYTMVLVPFLTMRGTKCRANQFNNSSSGDPRSVVKVLTSIYPRISSSSDFNFGVSGPEPEFLDISSPDVSFFDGEGPIERRAVVNDLGLRMQGNITVGSSIANVHDSSLTNAYYTELLNAPAIDLDGWSKMAETYVTSISNRFAFDPNQVSDNILRILPVNYAVDERAYIGITRETISVDVSAPYFSFKTPQFLMSVHPVQGSGTETGISDVAKIKQHIGGGFIDTIRDIGGMAIPLLGQIGGSILDQYMPGMGGMVSGLGGYLGSKVQRQLPRGGQEIVQKVLKKSGSNPYAPILRPSSNRRYAKSTRVRTI